MNITQRYLRNGTQINFALDRQLLSSVERNGQLAEERNAINEGVKVSIRYTLVFMYLLIVQCHVLHARLGEFAGNPVFDPMQFHISRHLSWRKQIVSVRRVILICLRHLRAVLMKSG